VLWVEKCPCDTTERSTNELCFSKSSSELSRQRWKTKRDIRSIMGKGLRINFGTEWYQPAALGSFGEPCNGH